VEHGRFALTADTGEKRPIHIAWQVAGDAKVLGEELGNRFRAVLRDERIHGSGTF
jgi:hypothetical protein